jgi:toxin FitB
MNSRQQVLLDSNIIIYAGIATTGPVATFVGSIDPVASVVTRIEVLGFHRLDPAHKVDLEHYFTKVTIVGLDDTIVDRAILLRQSRKMSLGDSIIAATALEYGLPLATRNIADFKWIAGLQLIDPMTTP